jgi:hypothetical protein
MRAEMTANVREQERRQDFDLGEEDEDF